MDMATTSEILDAAKKLGELIATHESVKRYTDLVGQLQQDVEAQRAMNDFSRFLTKLGEKEQAGQPIEVADKHKLEELQTKVVRHPLLSRMQMAQMDYVDLLRKVDEAMTGQGPDVAGAAGMGMGNPLVH
jgi:cell fate (sporulation/competence/biofilm development) regulator YlbF (YheA/YmcA/DUF963 family)